MSAPEQYQPEEGAGIYRLCDVPEGWLYRYSTNGEWSVCRQRIGGYQIVEAKPPAPVMVTVPARDIVEALGIPGTPRTAYGVLSAGGTVEQRLLDAAWAAIDEAES